MKIAGGCSTKKNHKPEAQFRHALDKCSKNKDLSGALALYHSADSNKIHLSSYHFNSLLHLLSTSLQTNNQSSIETAFAVFASMASAGAAPTESTITTMARISAARPDGGADISFDLVKSMGDKYGLTPKLRTYSPSLFKFCGNGEAEKAYSVEEHMLSKGVLPEEAEIAALLDVSAREGRGERVYGYLLKLRFCDGGIGLSTAGVLESWFGSERAAEVGTSDWDADRVKEAVLANGGGFHGLGWLGKCRWEVARGGVGVDGCCGCCGMRLACVDIDRRETEKFAESVASLAMERETRANFGNFQVSGFFYMGC